MTGTLSGALEMVVLTDTGLIREHNEDAVFGNPGRGVAILADGMGGYNAGEVASSMATSFLASALETSLFKRGGDDEPWNALARRSLTDSIGRANTAIFNASLQDAQYAGMGTTLVMGVFFDNCLMAAHIGDSRLYRFRGGQLSQLTRDHSLLQEQIDCGVLTVEEARHSMNRNLVTRALGVEPEVTPDVGEYDVQPGDVYLFCSDGLNDMLEDAEIESALQMLSPNLQLAGQQLVDMANDNGGRDNVSVILVKILRAFPG